MTDMMCLAHTEGERSGLHSCAVSADHIDTGGPHVCCCDYMWPVADADREWLRLRNAFAFQAAARFAAGDDPERIVNE